MKVVDIDKLIVENGTLVIHDTDGDEVVIHNKKDLPTIEAVPMSVIENIKAEIKLLYPKYGDGNGWEESKQVTLNEVMKIIKKHIEKENNYD